ncbi:MAG: hypothetical protein KKA81_17555 [Bacteroidetes bacterium]|nr:hypothetical protein [Bacteroidota bacterium]
MSNQKGFIGIIVFIVAVAIIGVAGYYFVANKQPNQSSIPTTGTEQGIAKNTDSQNIQSNQKFPKQDEKPSKTTPSSVLIFVDEEVYTTLPNELNRFKDDIAKDLGVEVSLQHAVYKSPLEIRETIKEFYRTKKLLGSILIGDIPTFYRDDGLYTDWFYQDLSDYCALANDGKFTATRSCNTLDAVSRREIFSGRITPPVKGQEGIVLIKKYLDKNHEYRSGNISFQKRLLVYPAAIINEINNKTPAAIKNGLDSNFDFSLSRLDRYSKPSVDFIKETSYENAKTEYLNKLKMNSYEAALINVHGTTLGQFISGGYGQAEVNYQDIKNVAPNIFYVNLLSCSNGAFKELNYLAGWLLFSGNTMVVNAQSQPAFIGGFVADPPVEPVFFIPLNTLGSNIPIGDMIRRDDSLFVTQTFGDPTLQLPSDASGGSKLSVSKQELNFGVVDKVRTETITIRNNSNNILELRRLPNGGLTIDGQPSVTVLKPENYIEPPLGVNFLGFDTPSIIPYSEIKVLPNKEITIDIGFAPAAFQKSKLYKKGKYFDAITFITNDSAKPYLEIQLRAEVQ